VLALGEGVALPLAVERVEVVVPTTTTAVLETVAVLLVMTVVLEIVLGRGSGVPVGAAMIVEVDSETVEIVAGMMEIDIVPVTVAVSVRC